MKVWHPERGLIDFDAEPQPLRGPRFPVGELVRRAGGVTALAELVGVGRREVYRALDRGVRAWRADEWACALGLHPCDVWGHEWLDAADPAA